jgi:hypothetical protein
MSRIRSRAQTLSFLSIERFGGKVGRGLAVELCERSHNCARTEYLFAPVLTVYSQGSENLSETVDNTGTNKCLW